MEFQDAKRELLEFAKVANACSEEYKEAYKSETPAELLAVVKSNANWCLNNSVISVDLLEKWFDASVLNENCIYTSGNHKLEAKEDIDILTLDHSQATILTLDHSQATYTVSGGLLQDRDKRKIYIKYDYEIEVLE